MTKLSDLPDDIIVEIMSWLPPESLLRSTCVQKSWYTLIKDRIKNPNFVAKHLHNSKNKSTSFIFENLKNISMGCLTLYNDEDNKRNLRFVAEDFDPLVLKHDDTFSNLSSCDISHCNGIICFVDNVKSRILLCNPSTRETKLLPDPYFADMHKTFTDQFGLGYDCIANVYKVVMVCGSSFNFKAQVYTLGDDAWREIMLDHQVRFAEGYSISCRVFHLYCKGFYYWLVRKHGIVLNQNTMYSFDMHNEEFHIISLPDIVQSLEYLSTCYTSLTEWNESVVLFSYPRNIFVKTKPIEMWVMHQSFEGNKNSSYWTKYLSIGPGGISKSPTIFLNSEELLIKVFDKGLFSYNIRTNKVKRIHKGYVRCFIANFCYVKSLVSVNGSTLDK